MLTAFGNRRVFFGFVLTVIRHCFGESSKVFETQRIALRAAPNNTRSGVEAASKQCRTSPEEHPKRTRTTLEGHPKSSCRVRYGPSTPLSHCLHVDSPVARSCQCGFPKCFGIGGVCVANPGDIFCRCTVFHRYDCFRDHICGPWPDHMHA